MGSELQVNTTTVVSMKWRTVVGFARRTTVVSFRWRTLVVDSELYVENYSD